MSRCLNHIVIRAAWLSDAKTLAHILHVAAQSTAPRFYTAQQANAWSPSPMPTRQMCDRLVDGRYVFVAVDQADTPLGFIELECDGHIDCFYCHPDWMNKGIGTRLYEKAMQQAIAHNIQVLYVEASEAARTFFLRHGFDELQRQTLTRHGVTFHNYRMMKQLITPNSNSGT